MAIPTGLRGTNGQPAAPPYSNGPYTLDQDLTLSGTNTLSGATTLSGGTTISGDNTMSGHFNSQILVCNSFSIPGSDWAIQTNAFAKLVHNKAAKQVYIPIAVKVGDEISGYRVLGGASGDTSQDTGWQSYLYRMPKTASSALTSPTAIAASSIATANTVAGVAIDAGSALTTVHTVLADNAYFICVSATTPNDGNCGISIIGAEVDLNRK